MDELALKYNKLWHCSLADFKDKNINVDPDVFLNNDQRKGISLVIKLSSNENSKVEGFLQKSQIIEPEQYYYAVEELHVTVLSLISCNESFLIENINVNDYISVIKQVTQDIEPFSIHFNGITASSSCIMLQGFPRTPSLSHLRDRLRVVFSNTGLYHTIDQRYKIDTAHSTAIRFYNDFNNENEFIELLEQFRNRDFGILHVKELHLVYNDWYHKKDKTIVLSTIKLNNKLNKVMSLIK